MTKLKRKKRRRRRPALRFTPDVWAKLLYLRDRGETEIGGFGISLLQDLLCVTEFRLIPQRATIASVAFDDAAVADFFDEQVDRGLVPQQFGRIWVHTHPGHSPYPSGTDEETFARCFGSADWAVMFILAQGGATYARLRISTGPGAELELPVEIEYGYEFTSSDFANWNDEYFACVEAPPVNLFLAQDTPPTERPDQTDGFEWLSETEDVYGF